MPLTVGSTTSSSIILTVVLLSPFAYADTQELFTLTSRSKPRAKWQITRSFRLLFETVTETKR